MIRARAAGGDDQDYNPRRQSEMCMCVLLLYYSISCYTMPYCICPCIILHYFPLAAGGDDQDDDPGQRADGARDGLPGRRDGAPAARLCIK